MTALAIGEILTERHLVVVTGGAARCRFRTFVHGDDRRGHSRLGRRMARIAIEKTVLGVSEVARYHRRGRGDRVLSAGLVASEAFAAHERSAAFLRRMALPAGGMSRLPVRNYEVAGLSGRFVANGTLCLGVVLMAEFYSERFRRADLGVTLTAIRKIVRAERPRSVMARRATVRRIRMHRDVDR